MCAIRAWTDIGAPVANETVSVPSYSPTALLVDVPQFSLALARESRWRARTSAPALAEPASEEVVAALVETGFAGVRIERPSKRTRWNAVIAQR